MVKDYSKPQPILAGSNRYTDKEASYVSKILRFLMSRNGLVHDLIIGKYERSEWWGLSLFIIRGRAMELDIADRISELVIGKGFEILEFIVFEPDIIERMTRFTRGGNWEGGEPVACLICFDPRPKRIRGAMRRQYPEMDNMRLVSKMELREEINELVTEADRANFLHATDNLEEAWAYIHVAIPDGIKQLKTNIRNRRGNHPLSSS